MFFGTYTHNLDNKGRMVVPSKFRVVLGTLAYVMRGYEGALEVYQQAAFDVLINKISTLNYTSKDARAYIRSRLASVVEIEVDDHGRIALPAKLLAEYKIGTQVNIIGVYDHFEIWDAKVWSEYSESSNQTLEEVAEKLYE